VNERTSIATGRRAGPLTELALAFLRLGGTALGGPTAHLAMMDAEFVRRRAWLTREQLLDLVGAAGLLPGPTSTEVAIYIGYRRAGWRGLLVAGFCFIAPAATIVTAIAWAYVRFGHLPAAEGALYGAKAVIIAVVGEALLAFGRTALKDAWLLALAVVAAVASALGAPPLLVLLATGAASVAMRAAPPAPPVSLTRFWPAALGTATMTASTATTTTLAKLFLVFLKAGAVVFGSGYVLLAFLRADLVERARWITQSQLIDAIAVGQFTPGPVFTTATFVGYLVAGFPGALVATLGVFLPSFVLVACSGPFVSRLRRSRVAAAFLDGVNVASLALMAVVAVQLGRAAIVDLPTALLAIAAAAALSRWRVNSAWLVVAGGIVGCVLRSR
jgi:chromate transporter